MSNLPLFGRCQSKLTIMGEQIPCQLHRGHPEQHEGVIDRGDCIIFWDDPPQGRPTVRVHEKERVFDDSHRTSGRG